MFRTAHVTVQHWPQWLEQIEDAARQSLPVHRVAEGNFYPSFWDSPSPVLNLMNASKGFPTHPRWSSGGADALVQLSASPPGHVQKLAYDCLLKHFVANNPNPVHEFKHTILKRVQCALEVPH